MSDVKLIGPRRPPNRRGKGPSYDAAAEVAHGISIKEAARRFGVHEQSVIRAIRGRRVG